MKVKDEVQKMSWKKLTNIDKLFRLTESVSPIIRKIFFKTQNDKTLRRPRTAVFHLQFCKNLS